MRLRRPGRKGRRQPPVFDCGADAAPLQCFVQTGGVDAGGSARRPNLVYLDDMLIGEDCSTLELPDSKENPGEALQRKQTTQFLEREIHRIPSLLRNALVLSEVNELPMPEVAERLVISIAAANCGAPATNCATPRTSTAARWSVGGRADAMI